MSDTIVIIRTSSLPSWPDCERRSAARLFRNLIEGFGYKLRRLPRGIGAAVGISVHASAAVSLAEKARCGVLPPESVAEDCASDQLKELIAQEVEFDHAGGATRNRNEAIAQATGMARLYHRKIAPTVEPILVEERLEAELQPGIILSGQPDLVAREPNQIRDLKTGVSLGSFSAQIGGYSMLARTPRPEHPEGIPIERASIDFLRRVSPAKPQPDPVSQQVPLADAETSAANILRRIAQALTTFREGDTERRIRPGDPWSFMANPQSRLCTRRWCEAYGVEGFCSEWKTKENYDA
ncbi:MAG: hypothetical protein AB7H90_01005 [Alphaproteobacteria bacterium]